MYILTLSEQKAEFICNCDHDRIQKTNNHIWRMFDSNNSSAVVTTGNTWQLVSEEVGLFQLLDLRLYCIVMSPPYGDAKDNGNAGWNECQKHHNLRVAQTSESFSVDAQYACTNIAPSPVIPPATFTYKCRCASVAAALSNSNSTGDCPRLIILSYKTSLFRLCYTFCAFFLNSSTRLEREIVHSFPYNDEVKIGGATTPLPTCIHGVILNYLTL
jgi:hypothetical protein